VHPKLPPKRLPALSSIPSFDPRKAPILPRDERFAALIGADLTAASIASRLDGTLAHLNQKDAHIPFNSLLKPSAVLLPLMQHKDGLRLLLTVRSTQLRKHSGQIALPGGKIDAEDKNASATALREAEEEIGLPSANCKIIGALDCHETGTGFEITPIVALVNPDYTPKLSKDEVSAIFEVPLAHILNPQNHYHHELTWRDAHGSHTRDWYAIPSVDSQGTERFIWGVTALVLRHFYEHLHGEPG
jgi:8-oxo-dGTP pyrophosphatase MutT (NUDIX family)